MKRLVIILVGLAIGLGLSWLVFRHTDWAAVRFAIDAADKGWVALSFGCVAIAAVTHVQRFAYVVRATEKARWWSLFTITRIGELAQLSIPWRNAGMLVKAAALARIENIRVSKTFAMVALDRVFDLAAMLIVIGGALAFFPSNGDLVIPKEILGDQDNIVSGRAYMEGLAIGGTVLMVATLASLVMLYVNQKMVLRASDAVLGHIAPRLAGHAHHMLVQFAEGLHVFRSPGDIAKIAFFNGACWLSMLCAHASILKAFDLEVSLGLVLLIQTMVAIALSTPGLPGAVGSFHAMVVAAILVVMPNETKDTAMAVAIVDHIIHFFYFGIIGSVCLAIEYPRLRGLRRDLKQVDVAIKEARG